MKDQSKRKFVDQFDLMSEGGQCDQFTTTRGDWEPGCLVGYGWTPEEAKKDLVLKEKQSKGGK